jgi:2-dehydro-3-deoxyphosphogluconate aldolase/(4S)-4-hydroxy-2-oxoglutarate aldolase
MKETLIFQKILPAVTFTDAAEALPVTEALLKGGLSIMEVALRTPDAFKAIGSIAKNFPEMKLGAGTVLHVLQLKQAIDAGAGFGLSPSLNISVLEEASKNNFPFIPGVMTPSEIETAHAAGFSIQKLFPASSIGGVSFLKAMQGPYAHLNVHFIPMGGVNLQNMSEYLLLTNVIAVGGSWLASPELISQKNYAAIEENARQALAKIKAAP